MKYYLGIDGGGTKTKIIVINQEADILFENTSGPSSIDTVDSLTTIENIKEAVEPFVNSNKNIVFDGIFAGIGGIVFEKDCLMVENLLHQLPYVDNSTFIRARNDMHNALYSGNHFNSGMTLICGTGMVAFGKKENKIHKSGGWGFKEGELGSGYHLGREAIRHCIRSFDGRIEPNAFADEVANSLNLKKAEDIINIMEDLYGKRTKTASLAPLVTKHANLGDKFAKRIVDLATDELALAIQGVYRTLSFKDVTLVIVGSLGNSEGYFKECLYSKIKKISKSIKITSPVIDPALAAAKAARFFKEDAK